MAENEKALYADIERWLKSFCPIVRRGHTKEYAFDTGCYVDFWCKQKSGRPLLIEVKNWFITVLDFQEFIKYLLHAYEVYGADNFDFYVIAAGIEPKERLDCLKRLNIKVILTRDLIPQLVGASVI